MKHSWIFYMAVGMKAFLFMTMFFSIFLLRPEFLWKTNMQREEVYRAIKNKENLNQYNDKGATPLMGAACQGWPDIVEQLLDAGADIEAHAKNFDDQWIEAGNTALHYACLNGNVDIVEILLKRKANPLALNDNKNTPLYIAVWNVDMPIENQKKCIQLLVGTNPQAIKSQFNAQNKQGYTPLMRAIELRNAELVRMLIDNWGQHINYLLKNEDGKTAYDIAVQDSCDDTITRMVKEAQEKWSSRTK